jgi:tRNA(Arg) A34 adenosine deaminase TadA
MQREYPTLAVALPPWIGPFVDNYDFSRCGTVEGRMRFAAGLARENIAQKTGGPFGAAIFDCSTNELVAPGVNLVLSSQCSVLHAEIVAIMVAQRIANSFDLSRSGLPSLELVASAAPCAMCLGAIPWSGIRRLVCGARDEDARAIGFDEGAKVADWIGALRERGIETLTDVCRDEARAVFQAYSSSDGVIYNSKGTDK